MPITTLIVDDEDLARERIHSLLSREPDFQVIGECSNGVQAVEAIEKLKPDLVFLDIQMPLLDGFGVVEAVGASEMPATMFVTAYDQHALQAFDVHALDYVLKPFEPERFQMAVERARRWIKGGAPRPSYEQLLNAVKKRQPWLDRLLVRRGDSHVLVRTAYLQWMEAEGNYVRLHVEDTSHLLRQTLSGLLLRLDPDRFRRIHRSVAVNVDFIDEIRHSVQGECQVVMLDGMRLNLSRSFRELFGEWVVSRDGL